MRSIDFVVVRIINERDLLVLFIQLIRQDIMPDMQAAQSLHGAVQGFANLRVVAKFPKFPDQLFKLCRILFSNLA